MEYNILDFIYPPRCISCDDIITLNKKRWICSKCENLIKTIDYKTNNRCKKCSKIVKFNICNNCSNSDFLYDYNFSVFEYDEFMTNIIYSFKYDKKKYLGKALIDICYEHINKNIFDNIDILTPVPIHKSKKISRGFNQAEILCKSISQKTNIKMINDLVIRTKNTTPQRQLNKQERNNNLKNAFVLNNKYNIQNKNIMIIDDIYTTGATVNAISEILKLNGSKNIYSFTIAIV